MADKHRKHDSEKRATFGFHGRKEISLVGAPCELIQKISLAVIQHCASHYSVAYMDAKHGDQNEHRDAFLEAGAGTNVWVFPEHIQYSRTESVNQLNVKLQLADKDLVLVNGNHFPGTRQVVFLDARKTESLRKRRGQLTDIAFFIDVDGNRNIPDFLEVKSDLGGPNIIDAGDIKGISDQILALMDRAVPEVYGLVLAGGKSSRMGRDKGSMMYRDVSQNQYVYDLLRPLCREVFLSLQPNQETELEIPIIRDEFLNCGPLGAILSAFKSHPDVAWLVVACDLPLMNAEVLSNLCSARKPARMATAFRRSEADFPEPLCAIYEPKIYPRALSMLGLGIQCPRKLLINSSVELIIPEHPEVLFNANSPEDMEEAMKKMVAK